VNPEHAARVALAGIVLAGATCLLDCSRGSKSAPDGSSEPPGAAALVLHAPPTTAPEITLHNLDSEIAGREKRGRAGDRETLVGLVSRYILRAKYAGRVEDLETAAATSASLLVGHDDDAAAHVTRASALSAIHEFAAAWAELDRAAALKTPAQDLAGERAAILLATGREDEALPLLQPLDRASPSDLAFRASVEAALGHAAESDRLFELARSRYRDVSAFTVAGMDFEHSRALERGGDRVKARAYLTEAATVMPTYAHAVVHLASIEPPDRALARLQELEKTSDDPDVLGGEADALRRAGRSAEAAAMATRARAHYEDVVSRLPRAFADHAASFYLGMGHDPARALVLAHANAENRPTDEAVELWLTAAEAASSHDETCAASRRALALAHVTDGLRERATVASKGCP
jgi:tetratricopeptide (TPR) repeat protein